MANDLAPRAVRLLYVEDDESMRLLMTTLLARAGFEVAGVNDAQHALAAVGDDPVGFALAITDHNLPGKSGLELGCELRNQKPAITVVLVSGYVDESLRTRAADAGIDAVLAKPHTAVELTEMIVEFAAERGLGRGVARP